jgi:hypothetical protein
MPIQNYYTPAAGQQRIPYYQVLTSTGTWTLPSGYGSGNPLTLYVVCIGGGGGAGSGGTGGIAMSTSAGGGYYAWGEGGRGGAGGNGGQVATGTLTVTGNISYTIGAGGSGGAAKAYSGNVNDGWYAGQNGNAGASGGTTTFSTLSASGGAGGAAGVGAQSGEYNTSNTARSYSTTITGGNTTPNSIIVNSAYSSTANAIGGRGGTWGAHGQIGIPFTRTEATESLIPGYTERGTSVSVDSSAVSKYGSGGGGGNGGGTFASWGGFGGQVNGASYAGSSAAGGNGGQGIVVLYYLA